MSCACESAYRCMTEPAAVLNTPALSALCVSAHVCECVCLGRGATEGGINRWRNCSPKGHVIHQCHQLGLQLFSPTEKERERQCVCVCVCVCVCRQVCVRVAFYKCVCMRWKARDVCVGMCEFERVFKCPFADISYQCRPSVICYQRWAQTRTPNRQWVGKSVKVKLPCIRSTTKRLLEYIYIFLHFLEWKVVLVTRLLLGCGLLDQKRAQGIFGHSFF